MTTQAEREQAACENLLRRMEEITEELGDLGCAAGVDVSIDGENWQWSKHRAALMQEMKELSDFYDKHCVAGGGATVLIGRI